MRKVIAFLMFVSAAACVCAPMSAVACPEQGVEMFDPCPPGTCVTPFHTCRPC